MSLGVGRLSPLDALLMAADTANQHVHVLATLVLDGSGKPGGLTYGDFQHRVHERWSQIEPMRRQLQAMPVGPPVWVDAADIHLDEHLHHVSVDGGGLDALATVAGRIASHPLPKDRPLWQAWFVDGLDDDRVAVIVKIHHGAIDGVSGIWTLASFFDLELDPPASEPVVWQPQPAPTPTDLGRAAIEGLQERATTLADTVRSLASSVVGMASERSDDAPLPFSGPSLSFNRALSGQRSVAFTRVGIDQIKDIRRAFGVTVNDVVMGVLAGVLRTYLEERGELPERPLVAAVPVSERLPEHGMSGNRFSAMFYALPVHEPDAGERLRSAARSATAAKELYERAGTGLAERTANLVPTRLAGPMMQAVSRLRIADLIAPMANVIVSNVRGPDFPLYASQGRLESMFPMGPLMEGIGLGTTVVGYHDEVDFGFIADPVLVPDVSVLADCVHDELARLSKEC